MNYSFRKMEENDLKSLSRIMKEAFLKDPWDEEWDEEECYERLSIFYHMPRSLGYVLTNENYDVCGGAIGYVSPLGHIKEFTIQEFFVDPKYIGEHLGSLLMESLLKDVRNQNIDLVHFYASGNLDKFYSKFGYKKVENEYLMSMKIDNR